MPPSGNEYFLSPARYLWHQYWFVQANRYTKITMAVLGEASRVLAKSNGRFRIESTDARLIHVLVLNPVLSLT